MAYDQNQYQPPPRPYNGRAAQRPGPPQAYSQPQAPVQQYPPQQYDQYQQDGYGYDDYNNGYSQDYDGGYQDMNGGGRGNGYPLQNGGYPPQQEYYGNDRGGGGMPPPRVLIVGETRGVVARMFRDAGADVATCDVDPTETPDILLKKYQ